MMIATLRNWDNANRAAGNAYIAIHDAYGQTATITVTVPTGKNAKAALANAGWEITSGIRKNQRGEVQVTVARTLPGLDAANRVVGGLLSRAGVI